MKFKYAISVPVTESEQNNIVPKLVGMGYKEANMSRADYCIYLINNYGNNNGKLAMWHDKCLYAANRYHIHQFNEQLVLAICAIKQDDSTTIEQICEQYGYEVSGKDIKIKTVKRTYEISNHNISSVMFEISGKIIKLEKEKVTIDGVTLTNIELEQIKEMYQKYFKN